MIQAVPAVERGSLCIFEFFYLARPDTRLAGVEIHGARVRMGEQLAKEAPVEADLVLPIPDSGTPGGNRLRARDGHPVQRRADQEPLRRTHVHPARAGHARAGNPDEVQPARRGGRQASGGRRRLDRARLDDAADRADAVRRGSPRGARAHLVTARDRPVLLRDRPGVGERADRRQRRGRGCARRDRRDEPGLHHARRAAGGDAPARERALPRLPDRGLPDRDPGRQRQAPLRADAASRA